MSHVVPGCAFLFTKYVGSLMSTLDGATQPLCAPFLRCSAAGYGGGLRPVKRTGASVSRGGKSV